MRGYTSTTRRLAREFIATLALLSMVVAGLIVTPPSALAQATAAASEVRFVSASALNVRLGPGLGEPVIARLAQGDEVQAHERAQQWARIEAREGLVQGWVAERYLSVERPPRPVFSDARIRALLIEESLRSYYGSCPCPYNVDRAGRRCGRRSAYSRPGGASPLCYPSDVSDAQIEAHRRRAER